MQQPMQASSTEERTKELEKTRKELLDGKFPDTTALDGAIEKYVVARGKSVKACKHVVEDGGMKKKAMGGRQRMYHCSCAVDSRDGSLHIHNGTANCGFHIVARKTRYQTGENHWSIDESKSMLTHDGDCVGGPKVGTVGGLAEIHGKKLDIAMGQSMSTMKHKLGSLSTEVNIQVYIENFGQPLIVNEKPYFELAEIRR